MLPFITQCIRAVCGLDAFSLSPGNADTQCDELERHGLLGVLYPLVRDVPGAADSRTMERLRRAHETALLYKDYAVRRLGDLAMRLGRNGRVIMIKGLALCESVYREPLARPMTDVDLLIPDGNIADVREVLAAGGFTRVMRYENVWQDAVMQIDLHQDLWDAVRVPERTRIAPSVNLDTAPSAMIPGLLVMPPAAQFAHGAYHGVKHGFSRGIWLLDLALLIRVGAPVQDAGMCGRAAHALLARNGLTDNNDVPPPAGLQGRLLMMALLQGGRAGMGEVALALCAESWTGSLRYMTGSLVPSRAALAEMYGEFPYTQLLVKRCAALAGRAGRVLWPW